MEEKMIIIWPHIGKHFEQIAIKDKQITFRCLHCKPIEKHFKCNLNSMYNLRTHVRLVHPELLEEFNLAASSKKLKDSRSVADLAQRSDMNTNYNLSLAEKDVLAEGPPAKKSRLDVSTRTEEKPLSLDTYNNAVLKLILQHLDLATIEKPSFHDLMTLLRITSPPSKDLLTSKIQTYLEAMKTYTVETSPKEKSISPDTYNNAVLNFIVQEDLDLAIVEKPSFRELMTLTGVVSSPSKDTLSSKIETCFEAMKTNTIEEMKQARYVCVTADLWRSSGSCLLCMTAHWLIPDTLERTFKGLMYKRVECYPTFEILANHIHSILDEFEIKDKTLMIIADNASNFINEFRIFGKNEFEVNGKPVEIAHLLQRESSIKEEVGISLPPSQKCAVHTLYLLCKKAIEEANGDKNFKKLYFETLEKCHSLWNKQSESVNEAEALKAILGRHLTIPNATKWNSYLSSLEEIYSMEKCKLDDISEELPFTRNELNFLEEFHSIMMPFAIAIKILRGERVIKSPQDDKDLFLGVLLPVIVALKIKVSNFQVKLCKPLTDALRNGLETRFGEFFENDDFLLASTLMPKFLIDWAPKEIRDKIMVLLENKCSDPEFATPINSEKQEDYFNFTILDEISRYLAGGKRRMSNLEPVMKRVCIRYNTPTSSSAYVESMFSFAERLPFLQKGQPVDETFEKKLMLKFNKYVF